nr:barstar family protein [Pantoea sp. Acro-807]
MTIDIDFATLRDRAAFYQALNAQSGAPAAVGANLDALWDWLTGGMALPATICLIHAEQAAQQAEFAPVLALLEEAAQLLEGELHLVWR